MKQHIAKKQWDELEKKHRKILFDYYFDRVIDERPTEFFTIGQLIEYLGGYWVEEVYVADGVTQDIEPNFTGELIDALWEAVKYKLNKQPQD